MALSSTVTEDGTMRNAKLDRKPVIALLVAASLLVAISANSAAAIAPDDAKRVTETKHMRGDGRESAVTIGVTRDEHESQTGTRSSKLKPAGKGRSVAAESASANIDFWFYLADVELYADDDRDGYYSGIDLLFDVDTYYSAADIYAVAYLSYEGGPWEEYAVTEDFTIFGTSGSDDYLLVTDLVSGYPRGEYDLLVEVFDADTGEFLAFIGPEDSSELAFLPLEDMERDAPVGTDTRVTVSSGGGGSTGVWTLGLLALACALIGWRRLVRRQPVSSQ